MKNVLLVSIAFPPKNDPEALQVAKYFKYLSRFREYDFSVVTSSAPTLFMPDDDTLMKYDKGYSQKLELQIYETKVTNFLLRRILPHGIDYPDSKFSFYWQWQTVVRKLTNKPDIIYSRSNPLSSTLLAYQLKTRYDVPWVMHISDPWVDSPVNHFKGHQLKFHRSWERKCFQEANIISLTSNRAVEFYAHIYPECRHKLKYFPNVYDPDDLAENPVSFGNKLRFVYTGGLTKDRPPLAIFAAIDNLEKDNADLAESFEIIVAGPMDQYCSSLFQNIKSKIVKHIGMLSYNESLELARTAHVLLSIDMPAVDSGRAMFFPSKLLDYFIAKRKILAITDAHSTTAEILSGYIAKIISHNDVRAIEGFINDCLKAFNAKDDTFFTAHYIPVEFSAKEQAHRLKKIIDTL